MDGFLARTFARLLTHVLQTGEMARLRDIYVIQHWRAKAERSDNALLRAGAKFHSQNDEDGIIDAILLRLGIREGVFAEFGCGNGLENNTIQLLMKGWRGTWIDAGDLKIQIPAASRKLGFEKAWVTRENCVGLLQRGLTAVGSEAANLISMDLDGNDFFYVKAILESGARPDVFIVEYNAKFAPPIRFNVEYDPGFAWSGGDYFGASLQAYVDLFEPFGYRLVCCNVTGVNAFFVSNRHARHFDDVPTDMRELFMPPDYNWFVGCGHRTDPRSIETFLRS